MVIQKVCLKSTLVPNTGFDKPLTHVKHQYRLGNSFSKLYVLTFKLGVAESEASRLINHVLNFNNDFGVEVWLVVSR